MKKINQSLAYVVFKVSCFLAAVFSLAACSLSPVPTPEVAQYFLQVTPAPVHQASKHHRTIFLATIQSAPGYETTAMCYIETPYQLQSFTTHAWISPPAQLWQPLLESALQQSGVGMIVHTPIPVETDYRLDVHLNRFEQNFQKPESVFFMQASVLLQNVKTGRVMGEKTFSVSVPAQTNTPYAGVLAANSAVGKIDREIISYLTKAFIH